jgi:hypothetical protein
MMLKKKIFPYKKIPGPNRAGTFDFTEEEPFPSAVGAGRLAWRD